METSVIGTEEKLVKCCAYCGAEFEPLRFKGGPYITWQLYCSHACGVNARNKRAREKKHRLKDVGTVANEERVV